jgi:hypothetical protein
MRQQIKEALRIGGVLFLLGLVVAWSNPSGAPAQLPGIALDSVLVFHVERATALLAIIGAVVLVGWRALQGDFPFRLGQVEYEVRHAAKTRAMLELHEDRLRVLEALWGLGYETRRGGDGP